jgi:hypothetical protein
MCYYRAYSKKLEQRLYRVRGERRFVADKLQKTQAALFTLRNQVTSLGGELERAGLESQSAGTGEVSLQQEVVFLGQKLAGLGGSVGRAGHEDDDNDDRDSSMSFSILDT